MIRTKRFEWTLWFVLILVCSWDFAPDVNRYLFDTRTSWGPVDDKTSELVSAQDDTLEHILAGMVQLGADNLGDPGVTLSPLPFILVRIFTDLLGPFAGYNTLTGLLWIFSGALTYRLFRSLQPNAPQWIALGTGATFMMAPWTLYTIRNGSVDFLLFPLLIILLLGLNRAEHGKLRHCPWLIGGSLVALSLTNFYYLLNGLMCLAIGMLRWRSRWHSWPTAERKQLAWSTVLALIFASIPCIAQLNIIEQITPEDRSLLLSSSGSNGGEFLSQAMGFGGAWGPITSPVWWCLALSISAVFMRTQRGVNVLTLWWPTAGILLTLVATIDSGWLESIPGLWRARRPQGFIVLPILGLVLGAGYGWNHLVTNQRKKWAIATMGAVIALSWSYSLRLMDDTQKGPRVDAPESVQMWLAQVNGVAFMPDDMPHSQILAVHLKVWSDSPHGISFRKSERWKTPPSPTMECHYLLATPQAEPPAWTHTWPLAFDEDGWRAWGSQACQDNP